MRQVLGTHRAFGKSAQKFQKSNTLGVWDLRTLMVKGRALKPMKHTVDKQCKP